MSSISAKHILVNHEYEASDLIKKLNDGVNFEKLAEDFSECSSAKDGGDLGSFGKGMMVPAFEKVAFALKVGETSGVVKTQFGFHLIMRTA